MGTCVGEMQRLGVRKGELVGSSGTDVRRGGERGMNDEDRGRERGI